MSYTVQTAAEVIWKRHTDQLLLSKETQTETPVMSGPELFHPDPLVFTLGLTVTCSALLFIMGTLYVEEEMWHIGVVPDHQGGI